MTDNLCLEMPCVAMPMPFLRAADLFNNFKTLMCTKLGILSSYFHVIKDLGLGLTCYCASLELLISGNSKVFQTKTLVIL